MMRNTLSLMVVAAALACSPPKGDASKDTLQ